MSCLLYKIALLKSISGVEPIKH